MKNTLILAAASLALTCSFAQAQEVKPGNAPTEAVGSQVPKMKGDCADKQASIDTKAPGTEATEATGKSVPTMTADAADCMDHKSSAEKGKSGSDTMKN